MPNSFSVPTIVQLDSSAPAGQFADHMPSARIVRFDDGELLPPLASMTALVVLGGNANAYDPQLQPVADLLREATAAKLPTLGVCLGAQLLATSHGGTVMVAAPNGPERGIIAVRMRPDAETDPVLGGLVAHMGRQVHVVSMHSDAVTRLPEGAVWLASSQQYPHQAFRVGSALGVQFHPEADATTYGQLLHSETGVEPAAGYAEWHEHADALIAVSKRVVEGFKAQIDESHQGAEAGSQGPARVSG